MTERSLCLAPALLLAMPLAARGGDALPRWPQFHGPGGSGIAEGQQAAPVEFGPEKGLLWKTPLPIGHSSPVIWGNRIFLTSVIEGAVVPGAKAVPHKQGKDENWIHPDSVAGDRSHTFKVLALDTKSGRTLWEHTPYEGVVYDARHRRSSFASPTVATDGRFVFAYFGPEGLYAYDVSGKLLWKVVEKFPHLGLGVGTSPVLFENLVIIQRDEDNGDNSILIAYDKATGKEAWRQKRPVEISWGTPLLAASGGRTELITNGSQFIIGYDPTKFRQFVDTLPSRR